MKPITIITHVDRADVSLLDETTQERGYTAQTIRPYRGEKLPDLKEVGAVIAMGGPQSAYEDQSYLLEEGRYLADAVAAEIPVLGICLGAQILSRAFGGSAHPGQTGLEAGIIQVNPTGATTPKIAGEFFSFHSDSMTAPDDAEVIAASDRYPQAWTLGSALAVQFHPEITLQGVDDLLTVEGPKLEQYGVDVTAMRRDAEQYFVHNAVDSQTLLTEWFDRITDWT